MLKKLLRYEFKYYLRVMPLLYLGLAVLALAAGIQLRGQGQGQAGNLVHEIERGGNWLVVIWVCLFTAIAVITMVMIVQRFRENLLKDPGFLMFTLPVTAWALTASKVIAALCMTLLSALAGIASMFILGLGSGRQFLVNMDWPWFWETLLTGNNLCAAVILLVLIFQQICLVYALMSASHLLPRFRAFAAFGAYLVVMTLVEQPISRAVTGIALHGFSDFSYLIPFGITAVAFAALYFWLTGFLLKHTLNLE
ncbi:ABC transporter permease [Spirochaetia bacterium]|nr:ABC transporter permease [Spirochaetia bacterium]